MRTDIIYLREGRFPEYKDPEFPEYKGPGFPDYKGPGFSEYTIFCCISSGRREEQFPETRVVSQDQSSFPAFMGMPD
jgi:hypothetical protein